jgi:hypothetical protein
MSTPSIRTGRLLITLIRIECHIFPTRLLYLSQSDLRFLSHCLLPAFQFGDLEDGIQTCKPQYLAHSQGRAHQPQISTSRLERYQSAYSRRINCSYAAEVQNDISPMLLNDRAQQRTFLAADESAPAAHSHHAARTLNGYFTTVQSSRGQSHQEKLTQHER